MAMIFLVAFANASWAASGDPVLEPITIDQIESTDKSGSDGTLITGTAGTNTYAAVWNGDGDLVDGPGVPAIIDLSNLASVAINTSLISDTANTDDLGSDGIYWKKLYLASEIQFEGATDDGFKTTLSVTDPTGNRTITIPDSNQTVGTATSAATDAIDAITEIAAALKSGSDTTLITGTAGSSGNLAVWNADGDIVDGGSPTGTPGSFGSPSNKTIALGIVDLSAGENFAHLAGEGAAADDLTEIQASAAGDIVVLQRQSVAYTITVKDGTYLLLQADFALDDDGDSIMLICTSVGTNDTFAELGRANNG
jgi:hypothetical protein